MSMSFRVLACLREQTKWSLPRSPIEYLGLMVFPFFLSTSIEALNRCRKSTYQIVLCSTFPGWSVITGENADFCPFQVRPIHQHSDQFKNVKSYETITRNGLVRLFYFPTFSLSKTNSILKIWQYLTR